MSINTSYVKTLVIDPIFEDRITIDRAWIAVGEVAVGDKGATIASDDTHYDADCFA